MAIELTKHDLKSFHCGGFVAKSELAQGHTSEMGAEEGFSIRESTDFDAILCLNHENFIRLRRSSHHKSYVIKTRLRGTTNLTSFLRI